MYIGGGMTDTHHRYEDYFLFHANRRSSIRRVPQPNGAAFVRWFPQEENWDHLYTDRESAEAQEPIHTASSTPTDPIEPMGTPFETPNQSPIMSPIEIHVEVETITVSSPPDPHANLVPPFSRSLSPERQIPTLETETTTTTMSPYEDSFLPLSSVADRNDEPEPHPDTQPAANTTETQHNSSQVIENVESESLSLVTTPSEPGYDAIPSSTPSSPLSLPLYSISSPSSAPSVPSTLHKATYNMTSSDRTVSPLVIAIKEAPLPFMNAEFTLSPITEDDETPNNLVMFSSVEPAFAPNVITAGSSTTEHISDTVYWGVPSDEDQENVHGGAWDFAIAEWEAMNKAFSPPPIEDIPAWNYEFDQDQENAAEDNMEDDDYMDEHEDIVTGTFRCFA